MGIYSKDSFFIFLYCISMNVCITRRNLRPKRQSRNQPVGPRTICMFACHPSARYHRGRPNRQKQQDLPCGKKPTYERLNWRIERRNRACDLAAQPVMVFFQLLDSQAQYNILQTIQGTDSRSTTQGVRSIVLRRHYAPALALCTTRRSASRTLQPRKLGPSRLCIYLII